MQKANKTFLGFAVLIGLAGIVVAGLAAWGFFLQESRSILENEISQTAIGFVAATRKLGADIKDLNAVIDSTQGELATMTLELAATQDQLATTTVALDDCRAAYNIEKNRMDGFGSQISDIQGSVNTLEKLKRVDPELLKKYSKVYFLNENYVPKTLAKIDSSYAYDPKEDYFIQSEIWPHLLDLLSVARSDKIDLKIISAYRSFGAQTDLKSLYKTVYGTGANKFSADQGYSEHQLGTTVDFTTPDVGAAFDGFDKTPAYQWLLDNAYTYGFALSYPQDNKFYQFEPWHWRFVGRALAKTLHDEGKNFYDLDQREIEQYRILFFD